jgi:hypothetical protein
MPKTQASNEDENLKRMLKTPPKPHAPLKEKTAAKMGPKPHGSAKTNSKKNHA